MKEWRHSQYWSRVLQARNEKAGMDRKDGKCSRLRPRAQPCCAEGHIAPTEKHTSRGLGLEGQNGPWQRLSSGQEQEVQFTTSGRVGWDEMEWNGKKSRHGRWRTYRYHPSWFASLDQRTGDVGRVRPGSIVVACWNWKPSTTAAPQTGRNAASSRCGHSALADLLSGSLPTPLARSQHTHTRAHTH